MAIIEVSASLGTTSLAVVSPRAYLKSRFHSIGGQAHNLLHAQCESVRAASARQECLSYYGRASRLEEGGGFAQEELELVVVDPVAGAGDLDQAALGNGLVARIAFGKRQKAFEPPEK
jgi:hypothetical protein